MKMILIKKILEILLFSILGCNILIQFSIISLYFIRFGLQTILLSILNENDIDKENFRDIVVSNIVLKAEDICDNVISYSKNTSNFSCIKPKKSDNKEEG